MPQDVRDLLHRRASAQKSAGHAVPENVDAGSHPSTSSVAGQYRAFDALRRCSAGSPKSWRRGCADCCDPSICRRRRRRIAVEDLLPSLAAVLGAEHAPFLVGPQRVAERRKIDNVGIVRMNADLADVAALSVPDESNCDRHRSTRRRHRHKKPRLGSSTHPCRHR